MEEYLAGVPEPARGTLQKVRAAIRSAVPPETTEVISYGVPTFQYKGGLLGFAAFANHCSLFMSAEEAGPGACRAERAEETALMAAVRWWRAPAADRPSRPADRATDRGSPAAPR